MSRTGIAAALVAALALGGCAVNHTARFTSLAMTRELAAPAAPIRELALAIRYRPFAPTDKKGHDLAFMAAVADRQAVSLIRALQVETPAVLGRNGIATQVLGEQDAVPAPTAAYTLSVWPQMASSTARTPGIGVQFALEIRDPAGRLVWRGTSLERVSPTLEEDREFAKWGDALADDMLTGLLQRWRSDGLVGPAPASAG